MFFWKKRKKEKQTGNGVGELDVTILSEKDYGNARKVEQFVVERLEQMIEVTKEIEDEKSEYRMVTDYLNDIQLLEELPEEERKKIGDIAVNVIQLNRARTEFLNSAKKLSDAQFVQMQQEEREIPAAIKRLSSNEIYRDTLKKDMKYLEREKAEWGLRKEYLSHQKNRLKNLLYIVVGIAATVAVILGILQFAIEIDCYYGWLALVFLSAVAVCVIFLKIQNDMTEIAEAKNCQNRAIVLENKVKIKFVNIENAVDYACEKYHVHSAAELNQIWQYYMEAVREKEKYQRTNEDLEYFNGRLVRELSKYPMHDARIWISQAAALVDPKEMVEVKHELISRKQKLRTRIEYNLNVIREQKADTEKLLDKVGDMRPQMEEILVAIDKLSEAM